MKDVQNEVVESIALNRVGLKGVRMPIIIHRPESDREIIINANLYLSLPKSQRGAHLSRLVQAMEENLVLPREAGGIEKLARTVAIGIKKRSEYCSVAEVEMWAERPYEDNIYKLYGYGSSNGKMKLGVEILGTSCCPCGLNLCGTKTHNQRALLHVEIETEGDIAAESLVKICNESFSNPVHLILKRPDEKKAIEDMHNNSKFAEDITRDCCEKLIEAFGTDQIRVWCRTFESIHSYDAYAEYDGS